MKIPAFVFVFAFASAVLLGSAVDAHQLNAPARFDPLPSAGGGGVGGGGGTWTYGPFTLVGSSSGASPLVFTNGGTTHIQLWSCGLTGTPPSGCQINLQQSTTDPAPGAWSPGGHVPPGGTVWCRSSRGQQIRCFARTAVQS
jgi:hypothetical protein